MKLKLQKTIEIIPTIPFDFDTTFHKPDHFTSGDNYFELGIKWQTFMWEKIPFGVKFENKGTREKPKIQLSIFAKSAISKVTLDNFIEEIKYRYNLNLELMPFYKKFEKDKTLGPIFRKFYGMRPGHPSSLYEYLIIGIVLQNASVKRSVQMFEALLKNYGCEVEFDNKKLWCFWDIGKLQNVTEEELRALKVGYRAKSIKKIDDHFFNKLISEENLRKENREKQMEELLKLYGVGPATVWYLLFDVFHNWDFFNHISPWEQKIYSKLFFDKDPEDPISVEKLLKNFEKYGDYKQLAVHYIWEDLWWERKNENIPWPEKLIRI